MESKRSGKEVARKVEDVIVEVNEKPNKEPKQAWQAANTRKPLICKVLLLVLAAILTLTDIALVSPFSYSVIPSTILTTKEYKFNVVPLASVSLVETTQLISMIPRCMTVVVFICRMLQLVGIFGLKVIIQSFQAYNYEAGLTPGYFGFVLLCGLIASMFVTERPDLTRKQSIIYIAMIGFFTLLTMACEFGLNNYQVIDKLYFYIDLGFTVPTAFTVWASLAYLRKHDKLQSIFTYMCYVFGFIPLMYLLVPTVVFSNIGLRIMLILCGSATYVAVSLLMMMTQTYHR